MDVTSLVDLPVKTAGAGGVVKRLLFGAEHIPAHELAGMRKLVTESGYMLPGPDAKGFIPKAKGFLFGGSSSPTGVLKARYRQGGILGKGGILRGEMAFNPEMFEKWKAIRGGDHSLKNYGGLVGEAIPGALNVAFGAGLPAAALVGAATGNNSYGDAAAEGASLLGFSLGAPFGLVGSMAGGAIGSAIGDRFRSTPPMVEPEVAVPARAVSRSMQHFTPPEPEIYLPEQSPSPMIQTTY